MDKQVAGITQKYYISNDELHGIWVSGLTGIVADVALRDDSRLIGRIIHTVEFSEIFADSCGMGINMMPDYIKVCMDNDDSSLKHYSFFKRKNDPTHSENLTYYTTDDNLLTIAVSNLTSRVAATSKAKIFVGKLITDITKNEYETAIKHMPPYARIEMSSCRFVYFKLFTGILYEPEVSADVMYDIVYYAAKNRKGVFVDKKTGEIVSGSYKASFSRKIEIISKEDYETHMLNNTDLLNEPDDLRHNGRHIHLMIEGPNGKADTYVDVPYTHGTKGSEGSKGLTEEQYKKLVRKPGEPDIVDVVNEYMKSTDNENFDWPKALSGSPKPVKHKLNFTGIVTLVGAFIIGGLVAVLTFGEMKEMIVMGWASVVYAFMSITLIFHQENKLKKM